MADVTAPRRPPSGGDRGQLILVTGLLVAVTIVSLVLLLNTAIYTENLASRGADQSGREAVEVRGVLVEEAGRLVEAENDREPGDWSTVRDRTETGVLRVDNYTARNYANRGAVAVVNRSSLALHQGQRIRQTDAARNFTNASGGQTDWTLATGIEDTRAFSMTVDQSALVSTTAGNADDDGAFFVELDGGAWRVFLYEKSGPEIAVATSDGGGSPSEVCSTPDSSATLNLTAGTLNGAACPGLAWAEGVSGSYDIDYRNGENITGTYDLTVNVTGSPYVSTTNLNDSATNAVSPYYTPAVYSVTFDVYFETPTLTYRAPVRVAPGEPA